MTEPTYNWHQFLSDLTPLVTAVVAAIILGVLYAVIRPPSQDGNFFQQGDSMKNDSKGFTLVELAIVIVIAGILAAVAIPIYQGLVNDSKWSEGKTGAGTIRQSVEVYGAKQSNKLSTTINGNMNTAAVAGALKMTGGFDNLRYFEPQNFVISGASSSNMDYTITVNASTVLADAPTGGPFIINQDGLETGP